MIYCIEVLEKVIFLFTIRSGAYLWCVFKVETMKSSKDLIMSNNHKLFYSRKKELFGWKHVYRWEKVVKTRLFPLMLRHATNMQRLAVNPILYYFDCKTIFSVHFIRRMLLFYLTCKSIICNKNTNHNILYDF